MKILGFAPGQTSRPDRSLVNVQSVGGLFTEFKAREGRRDETGGLPLFFRLLFLDIPNEAIRNKKYDSARMVPTR
jgi:hypothetical protein